jgi:DNA-binding transcriptional LysR family regulator
MLVCRHGKLTTAARELRISQPSLSQRIKGLEQRLQRELFRRTSTGVELTAAGHELHRLLERPFEQSAQRFDQFRSDGLRNRVLVAVDYAFASFWLLPRLSKLREDLGSFDLDILTSQDPLGVSGHAPDLTIYMADRRSASFAATLLFPEEVSAVCSPALEQRLGPLRNAEDLLAHKALLLHLKSPDRQTPWFEWSGWLEELGQSQQSLGRETVFNTYEMIIKAAQSGQGIALGWHGLIDSLLASGELVQILPDRVTSDRGYFIESAGTDSSPRGAALADWIRAEARQNR